MALVRKGKKGNYYLVVYEGGKQRWYSTGTASKSEAKGFEAKHFFQQASFDSSDDGVRLIDYCDSYATKTKSKKENTLLARRASAVALRQYLLSYYNLDFKLDKVDYDFSLGYRNFLEQIYASSTASVHYSYYKSMLQHAHSCGLINVNPCIDISLPLLKVKSAKSLTAAQVQDFLSFCKSRFGKDWYYEYAYCVFGLAAVVGLRRGEIAGLKRSDFNLKRRIISIRRNITYSYFQHSRVAGAPKTPDSERDVYLSDFALEIYHKMVKKHIERNMKKLRNNNPEGYLFINYFGYPVSLNVLSACVRHASKAWEKEGGIRVRLHDARHSYATALYNDYKLPISDISLVLGHSSSKTTEIYLHKIKSATLSPSVVSALKSLDSIIKK